MHENFIGLKQEKRDVIINAALTEFADKGFDLASTNEIVKHAGISKGALFHYFTCKKDLFLFLCDYAISVIGSEFYELIGHCDGDLILRFKRAAELKTALFLRYPQLFDFYKRLVMECSDEVRGVVGEKLAKIKDEAYECLLGNLDESLFRPDVPIAMATNLILWAIEGYGESMRNVFWEHDIQDIELQSVNTEFEEYLQILRKCFYRQ